jgi:ATP-dependent DNA helicase RecQ
LALANLRIAGASDPKFVGKKYFCNYANGRWKISCYQLPALTREGSNCCFSSYCFNEKPSRCHKKLSSENGIAHVLNSSLTKKEITQERHYWA